MATITPHTNPPLGASESQANLLTVEESLRDAELEEVLDDLSSRFILNMPEPELSSTERISFQIEQAHWYYEDFVRPLNPAFPSMSLKRFSAMLFKACPLLNEFSHEQAFQDFQKYKSRVPVCGAVLLNPRMDKCVLVKGWKSTSAWSFPKGKINQDESRAACAIREVREETGYDFGAAGLLDKNAKTTIEINEQSLTLYFVVGVPEDTVFETQTRKEISKIEWFSLTDLPTWTKKKVKEQGKFYLVSPFVSSLRAFVNAKKATMKANGSHTEAQPVPHGESDRSSSLGPVTPPGPGMTQMSQVNASTAVAGPSYINSKPNGTAETDSDRMSRLFSALSTGSNSTVTSAAPAPSGSAPVPALSPSSNTSDRTDKHIALLDSLLGSASGPSPGSTQRKVSEGRPLPPIPSGSRAFPSNGPAGHLFPTSAPSPPRQAPPAQMPVMPPPHHAYPATNAPPSMAPYQMEPLSAYTQPPPPPPPQQPSQPPDYLHNPQATYGYYPPAFGSNKAAPSPQDAHKGALLSLLSPNGASQPPPPAPAQQPWPAGAPVYQNGPESMYSSEDPRAKLGVAAAAGYGPSMPSRAPQQNMNMPSQPMQMPPMNGPFATHDQLNGPSYNPGPMPQPVNGAMNMPMNGPPPMNMYENHLPPPFPPSGQGYMPNPPPSLAPIHQQQSMSTLPPPDQQPSLRQPLNQAPAVPAQDYPYSGPASSIPADGFFPKGLPRAREVQQLDNRRERVSGEQILYRPQGVPTFALQGQPQSQPQGPGTIGNGMLPMQSAPMPRLDMPKPRQPENLLAILNSGPRPHM